MKKLKRFKNIQVLFNKTITKIVGDGNHVTGIELEDPTTGKKFKLKTDLIFVSGALQPNSELFKGQIPLDDNGTILVHCRTQETAIAGISAAGTVADAIYRQAGVAAGEGIKASLDSIRFLCKLGFDGPRRLTIENQLYMPTLEKYRPLKQISNTLELFDILKNASIPVVIEFYSPLCSTCRSMEHMIENIAMRYVKSAHFLKVDITKFQPLVDHYNINGLPSLLFFMNGKPYDLIEGEQTKEKIIQFLEKNLKQSSLKKSIWPSAIE